MILYAMLCINSMTCDFAKDDITKDKEENNNEN
jgi:hypothetical protein